MVNSLYMLVTKMHMGTNVVDSTSQHLHYYVISKYWYNINTAFSNLFANNIKKGELLMPFLLYVMFS